MQILVFSRGAEDKVPAHLITLFEAHCFVPQVDAVHVNDKYWLNEKFRNCPHRMFYHDDNFHWTICTVKDLNDSPAMAVYFKQGAILTDFDWSQIEEYCIKIVEGEFISSRMERGIQKIKEKVVTSPPVNEVAAPELPQYYQFRSKLIEDRDVALFEITKANSNTPYTTIVRQFSINGYKPVFTNYFAVASFSHDILAAAFLKKLWEHFEMPGEFDLDTMLKNATEACRPGENYVPIAEPEVYTRSIEEVLEKLQQKEWGQQ